MHGVRWVTVSDPLGDRHQFHPIDLQLMALPFPLPQGAAYDKVRSSVLVPSDPLTLRRDLAKMMASVIYLREIDWPASKWTGIGLSVHIVEEARGGCRYQSTARG
jgi:hypothetical protein